MFHTKGAGQLLLQKEGTVMEKFFVTVFGMLMTMLICVAPSKAATPLMFMPFYRGDAWVCVQGPGGSFSHSKQPTLHAYDFDMGGSEKGAKSSAYGQMILSPVQGTVVKIVSNIDDFKYNRVSDATNNYGWGNQVIIKDGSSGKFVRINHMQKGSVDVKLNQIIEAGTLLGRVGQTGYSTAPHVHIQLQNAAEHSDSIPFNFVEGPMKCTGWNMVMNLPGVSVLDNDGATNLGNEFSATNVTVNGEWNSFKEGWGFAGGSYFTHKMGTADTAKVTWTFTLKRTGNYTIFTSWVPMANRDTAAKYNVLGTALTLNQTVKTATGSNWMPLKLKASLKAGTSYTVTLQGSTPGKLVVADSLVLRRID